MSTEQRSVLMVSPVLRTIRLLHDRDIAIIRGGWLGVDHALAYAVLGAAGDAQRGCIPVLGENLVLGEEQTVLLHGRCVRCATERDARAVTHQLRDARATFVAVGGDARVPRARQELPER